MSFIIRKREMYIQFYPIIGLTIIVFTIYKQGASPVLKSYVTMVLINVKCKSLFAEMLKFYMINVNSEEIAK